MADRAAWYFTELSERAASGRTESLCFDPVSGEAHPGVQGWLVDIEGARLVAHSVAEDADGLLHDAGPPHRHRFLRHQGPPDLFDRMRSAFPTIYFRI